jgi:CHASE3 domain sensor protein
MVEPVTAVLTGIALVKKSVDFIKTNIATAQDVGDLISHVDKALNGQQQVIKDRDSKNLDHFATENVAKEIIDAKLAQEQLYEMKQLIDHRFGHGTWAFILEERKRRIDKHKQAVKEAKAKKLKKQKEMYDMVRMVMIGIAVILFVAVAIGITIKFVLAHPVEGDETSCKLYEPKYFFICMNEGRGYADTELYLDYQMEKDNWIIEKD